MWAALGAIIPTVLSFVLPLLLKAILAIIEKREENKQEKEELEKLVRQMMQNNNVPERLRQSHNAQLERILQRIRKDEGSDTAGN